jgi:copper chaperone CopZ
VTISLKKKEGNGMRKKYRLEDLDCANCAAKMETAIRKISGVNDANVDFMMQKLTIDADDASFDSIMDQVVKVCAKVEPDCRVITK